MLRCAAGQDTVQRLTNRLQLGNSSQLTLTIFYQNQIYEFDRFAVVNYIYIPCTVAYNTGYTVVQCVGVYQIGVWDCVKISFGSMVVISKVPTPTSPPIPSPPVL